MKLLGLKAVNCLHKRKSILDVSQGLLNMLLSIPQNTLKILKVLLSKLRLNLGENTGMHGEPQEHY